MDFYSHYEASLETQFEEIFETWEDEMVSIGFISGCDAEGNFFGGVE